MNRDQRRLAKKKGAVQPASSAVSGLFADAQRHHQAGRLPEAEARYRRILAMEPQHADSLHWLGVIAYQVGRHDLAIDLIGQAIALDPSVGVYHSNLGAALRAQGRLDAAVSAYARALALKPNDTVARNNLGNALTAQGKFAEAVACFERVLALKPDDAEVHNNLGNALKAQGKFDKSADEYERAIILRPGYAEAHYNLANVLQEQKRLDEAIARYGMALELKPNYLAAHNNLGNALMAKTMPQRALASYEAALALSPDDAETNNNVANALLALRGSDEAAARYERALALNSDYAEAHNGLGVILREKYDVTESIVRFERALELKPDFAEARYNLALAFDAAGRLEEAIAGHKLALELKPDYAEPHNALGGTYMSRGDLDQAVAHYREALTLKPDFDTARSNYLLCLNYTDETPAAIFEEHLRWDEIHALAAPSPDFAHGNDRSPARRLRVGYVSGDFKHHSVAWFLAPLLSAHDRAVVEIYCYAEVAKQDRDRMTARFEALPDHWLFTVGMSDEALAARVKADAIDVLVDVAGHTACNRLAMFALKPAPVQVTWLGYPNTTGLSAMDYRMVDAVTDPPGVADAFASETLVRLDGGFLCYEPLPDAPEPAPPPSLAKGFVTFGSFNNPAKLGASTLDAWALLLARAPQTQLLLKGGSFKDERTRSQFHAWFADRGVAPDRVRLLGPTASPVDHLALYGEIDIALDPFPYNGTTTTCEAFWMGVPVVALLGDRHAGRVSASLLTRVGLEDLIAKDLDDYLDIAMRLAADRQRLVDIRRSLRPRMAASPLGDAAAFAAKVERAYRQMWVSWCGAPDARQAQDA
ncbi:MAG: tetratricopeptide repeat protein [Caulobacterales bacterium]